MDIELPEIISRYFAADAEQGSDAVMRCFAQDAVVRDEGKTYTGIDEIREWKEGAASTYSYTVEPFAIVGEGDRIIVTSHLVGTFPGSPVDLRYRFVLSEDMIAALEIVP
ncbi:nuclear transport factor 2 family protein [Blastomonas sp.]|uniref:nuclear transport factor 2 family protein n=1 Tax=Blastomonas sp. TaxID=1909299 RepID=UPI002604F0DF|nr:nuclear transport factor 2 family protein [Blastomonas sp.]MDM7957206.1 nuclear transport factor 2 family protein [Blastomonas sp.]